MNRTNEDEHEVDAGLLDKMLWRAVRSRSLSGVDTCLKAKANPDTAQLTGGAHHVMYIVQVKG